jgi:hypothetical protein
MKRTPAHKGAGTDELPRTRASFRVSFSNAEPNELYSRSRDFSIVLEDDLAELLGVRLSVRDSRKTDLEDDLAELLVDGDRVAELVGQLAVVVDRESRRCGGVRKRRRAPIAVATALESRAVHAVSGGSGGLPPTRPAKPHPEGTSTSSCGGGCGGRLWYRTLHYANARVRTSTGDGLSVSIPISGVSA